MTVLHTAIKRKKSWVIPACGCIRNLVSLPSIKNWISLDTNRSLRVGLTGMMAALPVGVAAGLLGKWFNEARLEPLNFGIVMGLCEKSWPPIVAVDFHQ